MDKTDRLRDYGLAFLLYEQGLGICGYELIRELFIFIKLILNSYLNINLYFCDVENFIKNTIKKLTSPRNKNTIKTKQKYLKQILMRHKCHGTRHTAGHKDKEKKANI